MIVRTPAIRLAVELREARLEEARLCIEGVANMMPCSVELRPEEARSIAREVVRSVGLWRLGGWLLRKEADRGH